MTDRVIRQAFPVDPERLRGTVQDGIVTLSGWPGTEQACRGIIEALRHVNGVVAVRDGLLRGLPAHRLFPDDDPLGAR